MTDISGFGFANDVEFASYLVKEVGIACVPGSSFYKHAKDGSQQVRFAFCKKPETLDEAALRLEKVRARPVRG
jgi:aminotransferase